MKPRVIRATARTPDGGELILYQHDADFSIQVDGQELMNSRQHESELELARLGCGHLSDKPAARILIGGLGIGYTLRQALDMVGADAEIVVSELLQPVVRWNQKFLTGLNGDPLADPRVQLKVGDVVNLILKSESDFDAIVLDIDNGPGAMTDSGNSRLYSHAGLLACRKALRKSGRLAIWSIEPSKKFERLLMTCGFQVRRYSAPAHKGAKAHSRFIWVAAGNKRLLPAGGGDPLPLPPRSRTGRPPTRRPQRPQRSRS